MTLDLKSEKMTKEYISSNLRLDGFSWCYFKTAKGHLGLFLVPSLQPEGYPCSIQVFDENNKGQPLHEALYNVPPNHWDSFFNSAIDDLNSL